MDVLNCDAACPHRRGDSLDRTVANITHREDARHTCLRQKWSTCELPGFRQASIFCKVCAREDKTLLITQNRGGQPTGMGLYADENKQCCRRNRPCLSRRGGL